MNKEETKASRELGLKAFYSAMKTIGYETITHEGAPTFYINRSRSTLMEQLSTVLENTYITMAVMALEVAPKEENLLVSKKFLQAVQAQLQRVEAGLIEKILDDEKNEQL